MKVSLIPKEQTGFHAADPPARASRIFRRAPSLYGQPRLGQTLNRFTAPFYSPRIFSYSESRSGNSSSRDNFATAKLLRLWLLRRPVNAPMSLLPSFLSLSVPLSITLSIPLPIRRHSYSHYTFSAAPNARGRGMRIPGEIPRFQAEHAPGQTSTNDARAIRAKRKENSRQHRRFAATLYRRSTSRSPSTSLVLLSRFSPPFPVIASPRITRRAAKG